MERTSAVYQFKKWFNISCPQELIVYCNRQQKENPKSSISPYANKHATGLSKLVKKVLGPDFSSGIFRDHVDPIVRKECGTDEDLFKLLMDHSFKTSRAFYSAGWELDDDADPAMDEEEEEAVDEAILRSLS